jgi:rhombotail lipoprotein
VSEIIIVPDYYLKGAGGFESPQGVQALYGVKGGGGFESLQGVQRLYDVDVMALVSYDQVTYRDDNSWSLGYLTIVGAYLVKGTRHDVTTLMDLAVVDPASRSILLRAGGADDRHGTTTLIGANREARRSRGDSFDRATDELIQHFDTALTKFETDVRKGIANVQVVQRPGRTGGAGALNPDWLVLLAIVFLGKRLPRTAVPADSLLARRTRTHPEPQGQHSD